MIQFSQVGLMLSKDLMLFEELKGHTFFFLRNLRKKISVYSFVSLLFSNLRLAMFKTFQLKNFC